MSLSFRLGAAALFLALAGCQELPRLDPATTGPFFKPENVRSNVATLPPDFRRVLILPLASAGPAIPEDNLNALDAVFQTELTRSARFEVVQVTRDELAAMLGKRQLTSVEILPASFVDKVLNESNRFGADGILFVDITAYNPYTALELGVRAKLVRIKDRSILWAADLTFSASDPRVANSARKYSRLLGTDLGPVDLSHTILQTPTRFGGYVASATFGTLPPR